MADQPTTAPPGEGTPGRRTAARLLDRAHLYQGPVRREPWRAAVVPDFAEAPNVEIGLRTRGEQVAQDVYECVLTITVTATAERQDRLPRRGLAGRPVRRSAGVAAADMQPVLAIACPNVLFPYAARRSPTRSCGPAFHRVHLAPHQLRDALSAAARTDAAAGPGRHQLRSGSCGTRSVALLALLAPLAAAGAEFPRNHRGALGALRRAVREGATAVRLRARRPGRSAGDGRGLDQGPRRQREHRMAGRQGILRTSACCWCARRMPRFAPIPTRRRPSCFAPSRTSCSNSPRARRRPRPRRAPGWVKVRHRDGQTGYVRLAQVFGL